VTMGVVVGLGGGHCGAGRARRHLNGGVAGWWGDASCPRWVAVGATGCVRIFGGFVLSWKLDIGRTQF
jgi:hypothetical protein